MWRRIIPCVLLSGGAVAFCSNDDPLTPTPLTTPTHTSTHTHLPSTHTTTPTSEGKGKKDKKDEGGLFTRQQGTHSHSFFQGISANADFVPYARPTDEQRTARGCIGKNFVYNSSDISTQYFWNPNRSEVCGSACFSLKCEGPARHIHGGALAAALDDAMSQAANAYLEHNHLTKEPRTKITYASAVVIDDVTNTVVAPLPSAVAEEVKAAEVANREDGAVVSVSAPRAMTGTLTVTYVRPVPLNTCQIICARVHKRESRKVYVVAEVSDGKGNTFVEANGVWIIPRKK